MGKTCASCNKRCYSYHQKKMYLTFYFGLFSYYATSYYFRSGLIYHIFKAANLKNYSSKQFVNYKEFFN
jgi:hypothetical protein